MMDATETAKIEEIVNFMWGSLNGEFHEHPARVKRLIEKLELWLDGETIDYIEVGWSDGYDARNAPQLWGFVLSTRFAIYFTMAKDRDNAVAIGEPDWTMVTRDTLTALDAQMVGGIGPQTFQITASFEGIEPEIKIPSKQQGLVSNEDLRALFLRLREDLFTRP